MTQLDIDRAVATATGESLYEISHRGFGIADPLEVRHDPEPHCSRGLCRDSCDVAHCSNK